MWAKSPLSWRAEWFPHHQDVFFLLLQDKAVKQKTSVLNRLTAMNPYTYMQHRLYWLWSQRRSEKICMRMLQSPGRLVAVGLRLRLSSSLSIAIFVIHCEEGIWHLGLCNVVLVVFDWLLSWGSATLSTLVWMMMCDLWSKLDAPVNLYGGVWSLRHSFWLVGVWTCGGQSVLDWVNWLLPIDGVWGGICCYKWLQFLLLCFSSRFFFLNLTRWWVISKLALPLLIHPPKNKK